MMMDNCIIEDKIQDYPAINSVVANAWDKFRKGLKSPEQADIQDFLIHWMFRHVVKKNPQKYLYCNFSGTIQNLTEYLWERELGNREETGLSFGLA